MLALDMFGIHGAVGDLVQCFAHDAIAKSATLKTMMRTHAASLNRNQWRAQRNTHREDTSVPFSVPFVFIVALSGLFSVSCIFNGSLFQ